MGSFSDVCRAIWRKTPKFGANLVNGDWFKNQARKAFEECDIDRDGQLDPKEVYIALLRLYDLLNHKLPCHVKIPSINEVNRLLDKYDVNGNRRLEFPEFLECCKGLIGHRKDWRESLFLKIGLAVAMKSLGFPYLAGAIKSGLAAAGFSQIEGMPIGALTYMVEAAAKQVTN